MNAPGPAPKSRPVARTALAALLFAMAAGQLSDLSGFIDILASYGLGGTAVAGLAATGLIAGELSSAVGLVSRNETWRSRAASVAVVVALGWGVLGAQAFGRGIALDNCGCFGVHLGQPLRWWVLIEDLEFLALAWWVRARARAGAALPSSGVGLEQVSQPSGSRLARGHGQRRASRAATMSSTGMRSR